MKDRIIKDKEFIKEKCSKCSNKKTDLCEIRQNIVGEPQCINLKLVAISETGYKFEKIK